VTSPPQLDDLRTCVERLSADAAQAQRSYAQARQALTQAETRTTACKEAQEILQTIAQNVQQQVHAKIASVVSRCLTTVFDEPYALSIEFERKRGRTEACIQFARDGQYIDPMTASGGGPVDVAAFALRLAAMMLSRPRLRRILILDEPFKSPSPHYRKRVRSLLETLSQKMSVQIVMTTNIMELVTGTVIDLEENAPR